LEEFIYQRLQKGQESLVSAMVVRTFARFVAPGYSPQGIEEFLKYTAPDQLASRAMRNYLVLAAWSGEEPVGMIEVRDYRHISLFYVAAEYQHRKIGGHLLELALQVCREKVPGLKSISVFSSPFAVPIYERLGFQSTGPDQYQSGMYFIPMVLDFQLKSSNNG
jgi:GNAT superfamily N-acetyltransferase